MSLTQCLVSRAAVEASIWNGRSSHAEIYRNITCTKAAEQQGWCSMKCKKNDSDCFDYYEQRLSTSSQSFNGFRCMKSEDLKRLVEQAMKSCERKK